jgi:hypothetical protein
MEAMAARRVGGKVGVDYAPSGDFNVGLLCKKLIHHPFCFAILDK